MIEVKIIDLPNGYPNWIYKPPQPTYFTVMRRGTEALSERYDAVDPLILEVGDTVICGEHNEIPLPLLELTVSNSAHPAYAVITVIQDITEQEVCHGQPAKAGPLFVG